MRTVYIILVVVFCSLSSGSEIVLDFDSLPTEQGWTFHATPHWIANNFFSLESSVLTMDSMGLGYGGGSGAGSYLLYDEVSMEPFTLSFRARCLEEEINAGRTAQSFYVGLYAGAQYFWISLGTDQIAVGAGNDRADYTPFDNTVFHDFVLEGVPGMNEYTIKIDDDPSLTIHGESPWYIAQNYIFFGDGSSSGNARVEITALSFCQPESSENETPTADAGADQEHYAEADGARVVTLDGSASSDPDSTPGTNDDIVSFTWSEGGTPLGVGELLEIRFERGSHVVTLEVEDTASMTSRAEVNITVLNNPPVADAGADQEVISANGVDAVVTLEGLGLDLEGDPLNYTWTVGGQIISGETVEMILPVGANTITLTVSDGPDEDSDKTVVTVVTTGEASEKLAEEIDNMVEGNNLPAGTANSLVSNLEAAAESLDDDNVRAGVNKLRAFQNKVDAQSGKKIDAETASDLIGLAQEIIDAAEG